VHDIYREWRSVVDSYGPGRILVAEAWVEPPERLARYVRPDEMHQAFNFEYLLAPWNADVLRPLIGRSLAAVAAVGATTTWVLSNHDVVRHASRMGLPPEAEDLKGIGPDDPQPDAELGLRRARAATLLMLALPGAAYLYQGEELGLPEHTTLPDELRQDPTWRRSSFTDRGRDGCRVPVPWRSDAPAYGFSPTGESWLPQPPSYGELAPDRQRGVDGSTLELYREALKLRRDRGLGDGPLTMLAPADGPVLVARNGSTLILANTGTEPVRLPDGAWPLVSSGPIGPGGTVPADTTVWASVQITSR
jgi:alpha-glucosidase